MKKINPYVNNTIATCLSSNVQNVPIPYILFKL